VGEATTRARERELKVDLAEDAVAPAFDGWEALADDTVELAATYWDTADLRLLGWGHTLRRRRASDGSEDGWTLKLARPKSEPGVATRDEIDAPPDTDHPPAHLREVVAAVVRREPLRPVATVTTQRHRRRLRDPGSGGVVEVADDRVTTTVDDGPGPTLRQLEVELVEGDERALDAAAAVLRRAGTGPADASPKLARALAGRPVAPPVPTTPANGAGADPGPGPGGKADTGKRRGRRGGDDAAARASRDGLVTRQATVEDVVRASLVAGTRRLLAHDPGVRLGDDPEDVHQARVGTRRLRADLRTLSPLLDDFRVQGMRRELQWLGEQLGGVRDLDVLAAHLRADADTLEPDDRAGVEPLLARLAADRHRAGLTLHDAMASSRYLALLDGLDRLVRQPPLRPDLDAGRRATRTARRLLRRADRRAVRFARALGRRPDDPALHELRKRAKGARYAAELVAPLAPGHVQRLARRLADVQDVLGDLQDTVVADDWLQAQARHDLSPAEARTATQLAERQRQRRDAVRAHWHRAWKRAARPDLRKWFR
jgi:CHAD domain-containing protein